MKSIAELFARIQGAQARELAARTAVREALGVAAGIDADISAISFKGFVVNVKGLSQTAKAHGFTKKAAVIDEIARRLSGRTVSDIRFL